MDRVAAGIELDALVLAGQESRRPLPRGDRLRIAAAHAGEDDESGQVLAFAAETVEHPGTHRRTAADRRPGVHERVRRVMVDLLGNQRAHHGDIVGHLGVPRQVIADVQSVFAMLAELDERPEALELFALKLRDGLPGRIGVGHRLAVKLRQFGFGVEGFEMGRSAGHAEKNDSLDAGRSDRMGMGEHTLVGKQRGERGAAQSDSAGRQERPSMLSHEPLSDELVASGCFGQIQKRPGDHGPGRAFPIGRRRGGSSNSHVQQLGGCVGCVAERPTTLLKQPLQDR